MREDGSVFVRLREGDGVERFRERADLSYCHENRIRGSAINSLLEKLHVRHEQIIADELNLVAELVGEQFPSRPVAFGAAVFDGDDGIIGAEFGVKLHQLLAFQSPAIALLEGVSAIPVVKLDRK